MPLGWTDPIGTKSGNGINIKRRIALGNALDWRIATLALKRVIYLYSIGYDESRSSK